MTVMATMFITPALIQAEWVKSVTVDNRTGKTIRAALTARKSPYLPFIKIIGPYSQKKLYLEQARREGWSEGWVVVNIRSTTKYPAMPTEQDIFRKLPSELTGHDVVATVRAVLDQDTGTEGDEFSLEVASVKLS